MQITRPTYYDEFRCIAGACPDSCCKEWAVVVDEDKAAFYRSLPGDLGQRLRSVLAEEDGETVMTIENGRCPMWRADGLCRIQAELGEGALCTTCRDFPRLTHDYGDFVERQLELSCPVAAQLILRGDGSRVGESLPGGECDYDAEAMEILLRTRAAALALLEADVPVQRALAALLLFGYDAQQELDGGAEAVPDVKLESLGTLQLTADARPLLDFFKGLEILNRDWLARLHAPERGAWTDAYRALARYFVERYWLQAVSDYDLVGRVKLVVISCLVIRTLGGDLCRTAQQYSKEIENDADNIDAILDGAYADPALTDAALLGLLLVE